MKTATFDKKFKVLTYFVQTNVTENINCKNVNSAKEELKNTTITHNRLNVFNNLKLSKIIEL